MTKKELFQRNAFHVFMKAFKELPNKLSYSRFLKYWTLVLKMSHNSFYRIQEALERYQIITLHEEPSSLKPKKMLTLTHKGQLVRDCLFTLKELIYEPDAATQKRLERLQAELKEQMEVFY